jgi:hypothetical protein
VDRKPSKEDASHIDPGAEGESNVVEMRPAGELGGTLHISGQEELAGSRVAPHLLRELSVGAAKGSGVPEQQNIGAGKLVEKNRASGVATPISGWEDQAEARDALEEELERENDEMAKELECLAMETSACNKEDENMGVLRARSICRKADRVLQQRVVSLPLWE